MIKISATMQLLLPTHKHKNVEFFSTLHLLSLLFLYVASAIETSRSWQKQDCLKLSHRHNTKAEECTISYILPEWHGWPGLDGNSLPVTCFHS